jgi:hypothetical protein
VGFNNALRKDKGFAEYVSLASNAIGDTIDIYLIGYLLRLFAVELNAPDVVMAYYGGPHWATAVKAFMDIQTGKDQGIEFVSRMVSEYYDGDGFRNIPEKRIPVLKRFRPVRYIPRSALSSAGGLETVSSDPRLFARSLRVVKETIEKRLSHLVSHLDYSESTFGWKLRMDYGFSVSSATGDAFDRVFSFEGSDPGEAFEAIQLLVNERIIRFESEIRMGDVRTRTLPYLIHHASSKTDERKILYSMILIAFFQKYRSDVSGSYEYKKRALAKKGWSATDFVYSRMLPDYFYAKSVKWAQVKKLLCIPDEWPAPRASTVSVPDSLKHLLKVGSFAGSPPNSNAGDGDSSDSTSSSSSSDSDGEDSENRYAAKLSEYEHRATTAKSKKKKGTTSIATTHEREVARRKAGLIRYTYMRKYMDKLEYLLVLKLSAMENHPTVMRTGVGRDGIGRHVIDDVLLPQNPVFHTEERIVRAYQLRTIQTPHGVYDRYVEYMNQPEFRQLRDELVNLYAAERMISEEHRRDFRNLVEKNDPTEESKRAERARVLYKYEIISSTGPYPIEGDGSDEEEGAPPPPVVQAEGEEENVPVQVVVQQHNEEDDDSDYAPQLGDGRGSGSEADSDDDAMEVAPSPARETRSQRKKE